MFHEGLTCTNTSVTQIRLWHRSPLSANFGTVTSILFLVFSRFANFCFAHVFTLIRVYLLDDLCTVTRKAKTDLTHLLELWLLLSQTRNIRRLAPHSQLLPSPGNQFRLLLLSLPTNYLTLDTCGDVGIVCTLSKLFTVSHKGEHRTTVHK